MFSLNLKNIESVPLFLHFSIPIVTYIIDNKVFACEDDMQTTEMYPKRAFELLHQIYSLKIGKEIIPKEFYIHFKNNTPPKPEKPFHCLIGIGQYEGHVGLIGCLDLSIRETMDESHPIELYDFVYNNRRLDFVVSLTPLETFLIFANLVTNTYCNHSLFLHKQIDMKTFDETRIKEETKNNRTFSEDPIAFFAIDYFGFIRRSLLSNKLTPYEILRTGGTVILEILSTIKQVQSFIEEMLQKTLKHEKLSLNTKILYYTLFDHLSESNLPIGKEVEQFYYQNQDILKGLDAEVRKTLPPRREEDLDTPLWKYR